MGRNKKRPIAHFKNDLQKIPGIQAEDRSSVRGYIADSSKSFIQLFYRGDIGHEDQVV